MLPPLKPNPMRPLGFRHLPDLGLEFCLVGEEVEDEHLVSCRRERARTLVWLEKKLRVNVCLEKKLRVNVCLEKKPRATVCWVASAGATCVGQRPLGQPPLEVRFVRRLWRNGIFGKLVIGNVLRGRRAYPAGGPTRAAVRNPGGAPDNTKYFPP